MQRLPPSPSSDHDQQRGTDNDTRAAPPSSSLSPVTPQPSALRIRKEKRFQVSRACARCKRLQKGCSQSRPCQRCLAVGLGEYCSDQSTTSPSAASVADNGGRPARNHSAEIPPAFGRRADLLMDKLMPHCLLRFLSRMQPTVPVLTADYVDKLQSSAAQPAETAPSVEAYGILHAVCAMVLLQVDRNGALPFELPDELTSTMHGSELFRESLRAHHHVSRAQATPTLERVLLTFFIYACHSAMSHHSRAFMFLREATTAYLLLSSGNSNNGGGSGRCVSPVYKTASVGVQDRLFWLLLISERSHAIRYRRPITLYITPSSPRLQSQQRQLQQPDAQGRTAVEPFDALAGFWSLAALFAPLNTTFVGLLLDEEGRSSEQQPAPTESAAALLLSSIDEKLGAAVPDDVEELEETQKSNLVVTQLWLRIIVWQLRLRLGLLTNLAVDDGNIKMDEDHDEKPDNNHNEHRAPQQGRDDDADVALWHPSTTTYRYPLDAVRQARPTLDELATDALAVHGVGMTEKLYDIACSMVDVLALPLVGGGGGGDGLFVYEEDLRFVWGLVSDLPGGAEVYDGLLRTHLETALPHFQV
ncbi:hypothetical protein MCOR02_011519 [Pyricularia oryzae]|uniref:Zn(2)-C6 fungal-type domain-containing protein n=1 Tax=Pyricularia oryzae TaxID=318829 RepID=A0A4P7N6T5_PYROR|nr:hypothetical protein MCOR02_011519 [Pyricularia oryzae]KAI6489912.1 hypothetical protein MCOR13_008656 [Pyricularia oryzae]KAI6608630.1 hypothetical protein MCOR04_000094 [Pyricularia oryzae]QBZ58123.1 hypothetical protein PoMZ_03064 [Pyricularia oryzae]